MASLGEAAEIIPERAIDRKRQQNRERQQRRRERVAALKVIQAAEAAELSRIKAIHDEIHAEHLAPAVLRNPIIGGDGQILRLPRIQIVNQRASRAQEFGYTPSRSRRAAILIRLDWQDVGEGMGSGVANYGGSIGSGDKPIVGRDAGMLAQLTIRARLNAALAYAGAFTAVIRKVVLEYMPVETWAKMDNCSVEDAVRQVRNALARLADFYLPVRPAAPEIVDFPTLAPPREAYHVRGEYHGEDFDDQGRLIGACQP